MLDEKTIIYILGTGRNGSTLLDITLGNSAAIQSCGEIFNLLNAFRTDKLCSCGKTASQCLFWSSIKENLYSKYTEKELIQNAKLVRKLERKIFSPIFFWLYKKFRKKKYVLYLSFIEVLYSSILKKSGSLAIVDSSKNPLRASAIKEIFGNKVYFIHLLRDGRGQLWSWMKTGIMPPGNIPIKKKNVNSKGDVPKFKWWTPWYYSFSWVFYNLLSSLFVSSLDQNRWMRITYEEFVANPIDIVEKVERLANINLTDLKFKMIEKKPFLVGHLLAGNRIRLKKEIYLREIDEEWKRKLFPSYKRIFWFVAGWLSKNYGFKYEG